MLVFMPTGMYMQAVSSSSEDEVVDATRRALAPGISSAMRSVGAAREAVLQRTERSMYASMQRVAEVRGTSPVLSRPSSSAPHPARSPPAPGGATARELRLVATLMAAERARLQDAADVVSSECEARCERIGVWTFGF